MREGKCQYLALTPFCFLRWENGRQHCARTALRSLRSGGEVFAVNCSLQFFSADPYDVEAASLSGPASTVIKFDPVTRQTTSSKRGYPNPMAPFLHGYRCPRRWRCTQIKIQLCRRIRLDGCIIDGSFDGTIHSQCDSVIAWRKTL